MGMLTHIRAFIPDTDVDFQKHKKVLLACVDAGVSLPKETAEYFGSEDADTYLLDEKLQIKLVRGEHYAEYSDSSDNSEGFDVYVDKLPKGVSKIRFFNNW